VKVDRKTKLIKKAVVTDASVHDSQALADLVDRTDAGTTIHADSAYSGQPQAAWYAVLGLSELKQTSY
jgi:IS5 family transposase